MQYRAMQDNDSDSDSTTSTSSTCSSLCTASATSSDAPRPTNKNPTRTKSRLLLLPFELRSLILRFALPQQLTHRCPKCHREGRAWRLGSITPLLLCRQLYDESFELMYKNMKVSLFVDAGQARFHQYALKDKQDHRTRIDDRYFTQRSAQETSATRHVWVMPKTKIWPDIYVCNMKDLEIHVHLNRDKRRKYIEQPDQFQDTYWRTRAQVSAVVARLLTFEKLRSVQVVVWAWRFTAPEMRWIVLEPFVQLAKGVKVVIQKKPKEDPSRVGTGRCKQQLASEFPAEGRIRALTRGHTGGGPHA